jgi:hypothetical protein
MKKLMILCLMAINSLMLLAQNTPASPAASATGKLGAANATVKYFQPAVKGRAVWDPSGKLAPYGKVWRTGANNSTTIELDADVSIEGKALKAGKYALFTIPGEKEWVIILNNKPAWGAFSYKDTEDVLRVTVPAQKTDTLAELFTITIADNKLNLSWEHVSVDVSFK